MSFFQTSKVQRIKLLIWLLILISSGFWIFCNGPDDGGWYLNASRKVASGQIPYVDFMFPQGPLMAYCFALPAITHNPVIWGRILASALALFGIFFFCLALEKKNPGSELLFLAGILAFPLSMSYLTLVKTHSLTIFLLGLATLLMQKKKDYLAVITLGIAASIRLSLTPFWLAYTAFSFYKKKKFILVSFLLVLTAFFAWCVFTDWKIFDQLFLPFGFYQPNEVTSSFCNMKGQLSGLEILIRKPMAIIRCFLCIPILLFYFLAPKREGNKGTSLFVGSLILFLSHLLADRTYEEYQIPAILLLLYALCQRIEISGKLVLAAKKYAVFLLILFFVPWLRVLAWAQKSNYMPYMSRFSKQIEYLNRVLPKGQFLPYDAYFTLYCKRNIEGSAWLGQFSFLPEAKDEFIAKYHFHNYNSLKALLCGSKLRAVYLPDLTMSKDKILELLKANKSWHRYGKLPVIFPESAFLYIKKDKLNE